MHWYIGNAEHVELVEEYFLFFYYLADILPNRNNMLLKSMDNFSVKLY